MLTKELYSRSDLAEMFSVSEGTVRYWERAKGLVPYKTDEGRIVFEKGVLERFINEHPEHKPVNMDSKSNVHQRGRVYICKACKGHVIYNANYCHTCGTKLIFEG